MENFFSRALDFLWFFLLHVEVPGCSDEGLYLRVPGMEPEIKLPRSPNPQPQNKITCFRLGFIYSVSRPKTSKQMAWTPHSPPLHRAAPARAPREIARTAPARLAPCPATPCGKGLCKAFSKTSEHVCVYLYIMYICAALLNKKIRKHTQHCM